MLPFHRRLAQLGLAEIGRYGFVLAGGYAISANGMGDRPSQDVDLFTDRADAVDFRAAADLLQATYRSHGLDVTVARMAPTFGDYLVTDPVTGDSSSIQLGHDYRAFPPATIDIGPVLDPRDAVAGKMAALWSRGEARDYIDIDTVIASGRFTRDEVLAIGDRIEVQPLDRTMLAHRFREVARHDEATFVRYTVGATDRGAIIERFAQWADQIDPPGSRGDTGLRSAPSPVWESVDRAAGTDPRIRQIPTNGQPGPGLNLQP